MAEKSWPKSLSLIADGASAASSWYQLNRDGPAPISSVSAAAFASSRRGRREDPDDQTDGYDERRRRAPMLPQSLPPAVRFQLSWAICETQSYRPRPTPSTHLRREFGRALQPGDGGDCGVDRLRDAFGSERRERNQPVDAELRRTWQPSLGSARRAASP